LASHLAYGWNPHDEGLLAQTAERVLRGQLPHRDYDDAYTGLLAMYHAGVFRVLGVSLLSLRIALEAAYLAWLPAVYWLARRFAAWGPATFVTAIVAVWSVPNRVAGMPSWYNLFLATAGAVALCKYIDTRRAAWLLLAGVAGGLSVLVKLTGLFYIAGALLIIVWDSQKDGGRSWIVTACLIIFVAVLSRAVSGLPGVSPQWHFVVPATTLSALLIWREWHIARGRQLEALIREGVPFCIGTAAPIVVFLVPYLMSGSVHALIHGVLIAPSQRFAYAAALPQSLRTVWAIAPWVIIMGPWWRPGRPAIIAVGVVLTGIVALASHGGPMYAAVWASIRHIAPVVVIAGAIAVARGARHRDELWVILCMTALTSLVQFPYAGSDYFSYFAAFPILCVFALTSGPVPTLVGAFFLAFAVLGTNRAAFRVNGERIPEDQLPSVELDIPRTGLVVGTTEAETYRRIVALVQAHSPDSGYVYASPDLPEMSFLAERRNPTRILYDFLDEPTGHDQRVLRALDQKHVTVVVTGKYRGFSPPIDATLMDALQQRYPDSASVGPYVVRWRPPTTNSDVPNGK
jgi:hypothetical protein